MKTSMSLAYKLASTTVLAAAAAFTPVSDAQASCTDNSGQPKTCGPVAPPVIIPSPSPTGTLNNGGNGGNGGQGGQGGQGGLGGQGGIGQGGAGGDAAASAAASAAAAATAAANVKLANDIKIANDVKATGGNASSAATGGDAKATGGAATAAGGSVGDTKTGDITLINKQAKQATHISGGDLTSQLKDCVVVGSYNIYGSIVGVGGLGGGQTTTPEIVKGCPKILMDQTLVTEGVRSNQPGKIVAAYHIAGHQDTLKHLASPEGKAEMGLFAAPSFAPAVPPIAITLAGPQFAAAAAPTTPSLTPCNVLKKGVVVPGEWKLVGNTMVCTGGNDTMAPR